ncbi:MAG: transcriptional regulator [Syntrophomonadaceae bacterium]|nr:transcriptional regulator [Syntrophomonadaceae bacterium]
MSNTKNNKAWKELFDKYNILNNIEKNAIFEIASEQINEFREARLMTKFDHKKNLPKIFTDNQLSILPITRGSYLISHFEAYKNFEEINSDVIRFPFPTHIESIDFENITSEATALNCAYVSGILADFMGDEEILPTVSGRMSSNSFNFNIMNTRTKTNVSVNVANSQIEIDGGYEGLETLALIEAKNSISDDFLVRQLYYPYRLWSNSISKKVKSLFLTYSNGIFSFYEYDFGEPNNYNSLILLKQKNYSIEQTEISLEDIIQVFQQIKLIVEPKIPFPQADNFKRVINLCELLNENDFTREEITTNYDFDPRQTNYYTDAGRYLGLIQKRTENRQIIFSLTDEGQRLFRLKYKPRQLKFMELILKHKAFNQVFKKCITDGEMPGKREIVEIMKNSNLYNVKSEDTFYRRASSIVAWIDWILGLQV